MQGNSQIYYGVYVPNEQQIQDNDGSTKVFLYKVQALKEVKKYKKARFKAFTCYHEALDFALYGSEHPNNNSMSIEMSPSTAPKTEPVHNVGEKPSQFRGPKSQDLVKFRKAIESGNVQLVQSTVWENPRYLISSGDTPAILQEGSRYNALHVAAKAKNAEMCDVILTIVSSPSFIQMLYGEENKTNSEEGCKILLDLYLNTPDKGLNETPLHFGVKFGAADVVEVLVSYPQCNKTVLNKFSQMPKDMICSRVAPTSPALINKIASLLEDRFYVPVLRSEDNCVQPTIGEPFSPSSPPELNRNRIDPRMEIHAYAGPMKRDDASVFRKKWKTPPRSTNSPVAFRKFGSPQLQTPEKREQMYRLKDTEKGLERVGRELAKQFQVGWKEYWPFLGTFVDLTSEDGLKQLEDYIEKQNFNAFFINVEPEKVTTSINRSDETITNSNNSSNSFVSPVSELCKNLEACTLSDNGVTRKDYRPKINNACLNRFNETVLDALSKSGLSPFLCIEKSCQVFANRIANHIMFLVDSRLNNTSDALESEIKHLKSLIGSYISDSRFSVVNFQAVHWRIAHLVAQKLRELYDYEEELNTKRQALENIIKNYNKMVDVFSSDDEELNCYRLPEKPVRRKSTSNNKQAICLVENILKALDSESENETKNIVSESDCIEIWSGAMLCSCVWKTDLKSRKSYLKKGIKYLSKNCRNIHNGGLENISRRLSFIEDEHDEPDRGDSQQISDIGNSIDYEKNCYSLNNSFYEESSSEDEVFYDACSYPQSSDSEMETDSEFEMFEEPQKDDGVYLEGNTPTKVDLAVYTALKDVHVDLSVYPNVYRWRHTIALYSDEERMSWPSPSGSKTDLIGVTSTPRLNTSTSSFTPPHSWLRITGSNSPLKSLKALRARESTHKFT